jgi:hypothetical protein
MSDIFEQEVDRAAQNQSQQLNQVENLEPEMQEQLRQIEALASMDQSFASSKEYQDLKAAINGSFQASSEDDEEEEEDEEEYDDEDQDDESDDDSDIFGITKGKQSKKEIELTFEPPKEMIKFINQHYGVKDANKFFESVDTWRNQAQQGAELERTYEALSADLQALPADLKMGIQLWSNGEDHAAAFGENERLNFSDSWETQIVENLVQHYLSEEYDELASALESGDIDEEEFDDKMVLLARSTKRMFIEDKKALDDEREQYVENQKNEFQLMKKSALLSVDSLSKTYPHFSKSEVAKIRNILVDGKIDTLFMKADGSYNEDAAELVAYAKYGKKMLESIKKSAERQGESKANMKTVDSSPKTVRKTRSAANPTGVNIDSVKHLSGVFKGDPYA